MTESILSRASETNASVSRAAAFQRRRKIERLLAFGALVLIAAVWVLGAARAEASLMPSIERTMPEADHFARAADGLYQAWADPAEETLLGYVALGEAEGYGGPLTLAVAVSPEGEILRAEIANSKETPAWIDKVNRSDLVGDLAGKRYDQPFVIDEDLDGVTGATYTSEAIANAALLGSQTVARELGLPVEAPARPPVQFGVPEIVLLALFAAGFIGHQRGFKYKKQIRWGTMLTGLLVIGFIYSSPLTLAYLIKLVLGYWPNWQSNLFFYMLTGGVLMILLVDNKNAYCDWFCPFGAAQECLGVIGGAKVRKPSRFQGFLKWLPRLLALAAILLGVFFRSPGLGSFELFGTLFKFVGTGVQFAALGLVIVFSLFMARPWCNYLCPIRPVFDFIRLFREWGRELWQKISPTTRKAGSN